MRSSIKSETSSVYGFEDRNRAEEDQRGPGLIVSCRLLLGHAMYGSKTVHQGLAIDSEDLAFWKELFQSSKRVAVIGVIERRYQNSRISNVEISVACRQCAVLGFDSLRHPHRNNFQLFSTLVLCSKEKIIVLFQHLVIFVISIFLYHAHDSVFIDKPCNVVNMA